MKYSHTFIIHAQKYVGLHVSILHVRTSQSTTSNKIDVDVYFLDAANMYNVDRCHVSYLIDVFKVVKEKQETHNFRLIFCEARQNSHDRDSCGIFALEDSIRCFIDDSCIDKIIITRQDGDSLLFNGHFTQGNPLTAYSEFVTKHNIREHFGPAIYPFLVPISGMPGKFQNILIHVIANLFKIILMRECYMKNEYCPPSTAEEMSQLKEKTFAPRKMPRPSCNADASVIA